MLFIGHHLIANRVFVAPMAGVTDRPFRKLCKQLGAGYAVSEMITSRPDLFQSLKTSRRANHVGEPGPIAVQIAGTDPDMMAQASLYNIARGAEIIDINMGCPAKKVCNNWAGSALMQNESLAIDIVRAVVRVAQPLNVPVTLKMRTGWDAQHRNAPALAFAAEQEGVALITIHGRTRDMGYGGYAEHHTAAEIKSRARIPIVANGDIGSPEVARYVLDSTGVDAVMVGRAAQGQPWVLRDMVHFLSTGERLARPLVEEVARLIHAHLLEHYELHGADAGVRSVRKHVGWYVKGLPGGEMFRQHFNTLTSPEAQLQAMAGFWQKLAQKGDRLPQSGIHAMEITV